MAAPKQLSSTSRLRINISHDIINGADLQTNALQIVEETRAARPQNTVRNYAPKQLEFKAWCEQRQFSDRDTVTEQKLLLFLKEKVVDRPLRHKSHKAADEVLASNRLLAWRSVRGYVTAITDHYRMQKARGMNSHSSPRVDTIREYLKTLQRRDTQRERDQFADKGRDTLLDGYSEDEFHAVCHKLWLQGSSSPECYFRTLVDILLGHYMLTRGGDRRSAELSDLFTFEFKEEGPTPCFPLIFTARESKQNQHGRLETIGALRNKNPIICVLSGLAFYLLYRWDLTDEPFPDFTARSLWYRIHLMKAAQGDREKEITYTSQREWVAKAFKMVGVHSHKKTHIGRASGAKTAELKGVSEDQIRRAGRWNQEQMVGCYLNSLPREFMRRMAGHPAQMGCFEIRRAIIKPPDELLSLIWPELDRWKDRFGPHPDQLNDLAAMGLTSLLSQLREVILQDSVALRRHFPNNAVWIHPVFQHPSYQLFAHQMEEYLDEHSSPNQLTLIQQAMPQLADRLHALQAHGLRQELHNKQQMDSLKSSLGSILDKLHQIEVRQTRHLQVPQQPVQQSLPIPQPLPVQQPVQQPLPIPQPIQQPVQQPVQQEVIPSYTMSRAIRTVEHLWREWMEGLQGNPSIQELDRRWGSQWRSRRHHELQFYSLRLEIIKEIKHIASTQRVSDEQAMWQLNLQQQRMNDSIDKLCKRLRASRRAR
jgi:hypothetical protein